jgi:FAD/FMN-containing dehydrogenase
MLGNVFVGDRVIDAFSTDKSIMRIRPNMVAQPTSQEEVKRIVLMSFLLAKRKKLDMNITVRGNGSDKTGAAIGNGIIISTARLNRIREIDARQCLVRVEPGVTIGELNKSLAMLGLTIPVIAQPDHTVGGLLANDYAGPASYKYGTFLDFVDQAEVILSNGEQVHTEPLSPGKLRKKQKQDNFEGEIYRKVEQLIYDNPSIMESISNMPFGMTGYRNISKVIKKRHFDLLPLIAGSQGTLGIVTEMILRCEYLGPHPDFVTAAFTEIDDALAAAEAAAKLEPATVDIYDMDVINTADAVGKNLHILEKRPDTGYILSLSFDDTKRHQRRSKTKKFAKKFLGKAFSYQISESHDMNHQLELAGILEGYLNATNRSARLPFIDGASISLANLPQLISAIKELELKHAVSATLYGSISGNSYNIRPEVDMVTTDGRRRALEFLRDYTAALSSLGGTLAGSSPEGRFKAIYARERELYPEIAELDTAIKQIFDPYDVLNRGVKVTANTRSAIRSLRTTQPDGIVTE